MDVDGETPENTNLFASDTHTHTERQRTHMFGMNLFRLDRLWRARQASNEKPPGVRTTSLIQTADSVKTCFKLAQLEQRHWRLRHGFLGVVQAGRRDS